MVRPPISKPKVLDMKQKPVLQKTAMQKPALQKPMLLNSFSKPIVESPEPAPSDTKSQPLQQLSRDGVDSSSQDPKKPSASEQPAVQDTQSNAHDSNALLAKSEISVWIDSYDDIFSDFDPRPYRERSLSVDFLDEAKRYSKEKRGKLHLRILAPHGIRNARMEAVIKKRLADHFKHHVELLNEERREVVKRGLKLVVVGSVLLFSAAIIQHYVPAALWRELLIVFLEPAGWFCFWVGFEHVLYNEKKPDQEFYHKMSTIDVTFDSY